MEMLELVNKATVALLEDNCPFCNSNKGDKEQLEITSNIEEEDGCLVQKNDPGTLRTNIGGDMRWRITLKHEKINAFDKGTKKYLLFIKGDYFPKSEREPDSEGHEIVYRRKRSSKTLDMYVGSNAHHLIPGNASLKRATELLKWMGETVVFTTIRYETISKSYEEYYNYFLPANSNRLEFESEEPGVEERTWYSRSKGGKNDNNDDDNTKYVSKSIRIKKITGGYVTGKVDYNINAAENGIFLPSNTGIRNWSSVESSIPGFQKMYAKAAIEATGDDGRYRQFHDAHENYSDQVLQELGALAENVNFFANNCVEGKEHNKDQLPAPQRLMDSLNKISEQLKDKVWGDKNTWEDLYLTSKLSRPAKKKLSRKSPPKKKKKP